MTFVKGDEAGAHRILDTFTEAGGTFLDTADAYGQGVSEEILGGWLKGRDRDGLVVATKVALPMGEGPNDAGLSRKHIIASVEASLRRLGTDYIDLYQTHVWDFRTPIEETLGTLDTLVKAGKVRYLGASNVSPGQLQRALDTADRRGWAPYVCLQPIYNLLAREVEWELLPQSEAAGVGVIPYSPLQGGWLTGKYTRGMTSVPPGSRESHGDGESWRGRDNDETWRVVETVQAIADETEHTPSQVALRWLLDRPGVTAPIIGARTHDQLTDNLGAVGWELTEDQTARLDEASARPLPYPYNVLSRFV